MKTLLFALLLVMTAVCSAKGTPPTSSNNPIGIITPDIAKGVLKCLK